MSAKPTHYLAYIGTCVSNCCNGMFPYKSVKTIKNNDGKYRTNKTLLLLANVCHLFGFRRLPKCVASECDGCELFIDYRGKTREYKTIIWDVNNNDLLEICEDIACDKERYVLSSHNSNLELIIVSMVLMGLTESVDVMELSQGFITYDHAITFGDILALLESSDSYVLYVKYCVNFVPMEKQFACSDIYGVEVNNVKNLL